MEPDDTEPASADAVPDSNQRKISFLLATPILIAVLILAALTPQVAGRLRAAVQFPFQLDVEEGFIYQQALDLDQGRSIYTPIETEPYLVGNYAPLFPWLVSLTIAPSRIGLQGARAIVLGSSILIALLLFGIVYFKTERLLPSLLSPLLFVVTYEFHHWSAFARVDLPALAFTLAGLFAFFAIRPRWGAAVAAILFGLAAFTRQTAIMAPVACCISMALYDRRRLAWFLPFYLIPGLGGFLIFNALTEGQFYLHLVQYNVNAMDWTVWPLLLKNEIWFFYRWWIVALALGALVCVARAVARLWLSASAAMQAEESQPPDHTRGVVEIYFVLATVFGLTALAKVGSAQNYVLEPLASAAIVAMLIWSNLCNYGAEARAAEQKESRRSMAGIYMQAAAFAMGLAMLTHATRLANLRFPGRAPGDRGRLIAFSTASPGARDLEMGRRAVKLIGATEGEVLSDFPVFSILAGKDVLYEPFIMSRLAIEGTWDDRGLREDFRRRRFALMVTAEDLRTVNSGGVLWRYTEAQARAIVDNYRLAARLGPGESGLSYYFWTPRGESSGAEETDGRRNAVAGEPAKNATDIKIE